MNITVETLEKQLNAWQARIGGEVVMRCDRGGHFPWAAYHYERKRFGGTRDAFATHGTFTECYAALADYVEGYRPPVEWTPDLVGMTLGVVPVRSVPVAAE